MKNGVYIGTYPIKIVLLGGILGFILISVVYSIIKNKHSKKKKVCDIKFAIDGNEKQVKALIDSGNFLKEPITGVPVVVVETMYMFGLVPKEILENIENIITGNLEVLNDSTRFLSKFRVIPFNSLGKENGLLLGIKADYLQVIENEEYEHKKIENVIIGLYDKTLSKERSV